MDTERDVLSFTLTRGALSEITTPCEYEATLEKSVSSRPSDFI